MTDDDKTPAGKDDDPGADAKKPGEKPDTDPDREKKTPFGDLDQPSQTAKDEVPDFAEGADIRSYARDNYSNRRKDDD